MSGQKLQKALHAKAKQRREDLHPLESAALSRRTPFSDISQSLNKLHLKAQRPLPTYAFRPLRCLVLGRGLPCDDGILLSILPVLCWTVRGPLEGA
jgi:hypothetical protein